MKKKIAIFVVIFFLLPFLYIAVSFISNVKSERPFVQELDQSYIWKKCEAIQNIVSEENIDEHIIYSRGFFGVVYIFEYSPGIMSSDDFEIAGRSLWSELSCLPFLGCIIRPILSENCEDSGA